MNIWNNIGFLHHELVIWFWLVSTTHVRKSRGDAVFGSSELLMI